MLQRSAEAGGTINKPVAQSPHSCVTTRKSWAMHDTVYYIPAMDAVERPTKHTRARVTRTKVRILTVFDVDAWDDVRKILDVAMSSGSKWTDAWGKVEDADVV